MPSDPEPRSAVVLAGGEGRRLQPYTTVLPKPLMPLGDAPIIEIVLRQLGKAGFTDIFLAVGHLAELIEAYVGDGSRFGVQVRYSREREKLGTAGPLATIEGLPENFLVMNGDVLSDLRYEELFEDHLASGAALTVATYSRRESVDFGVLEVGPAGDVLAYDEKPSRVVLVSTGIYALSRRALDQIPRGCKFDFPELVSALLEAGAPVRAFPLRGTWLDIGRKDDYEQAIEVFSSDPGRFLSS